MNCMCGYSHKTKSDKDRMHEILKRNIDLKTICAWCGKYLNGNKKSKNISHGICLKCSAKLEG